MNAFLKSVHSRLGDFWWYSLMLFMVSRAADVMNAFVGLWLVPKYVPTSELGAVAPLMNFAAIFAIPVAAFASTFRNELTRLSVEREFGKLKTLMKSVFIACAVFLFCSIVAARLILPHFLERIRIAEGSLGVAILVAAFLSAVSPVYSNAVQSLKKFKAQSIINIVCAPVRFLTMLVAMPFRAITGYFVGQASVHVFTVACSVLSLSGELSVRAEPYWTRSVARRFIKVFVFFLMLGLAGGFSQLVESVVIRSNLPDCDSAGFFMAGRFSDISNFLITTLVFTMFPFVAEKCADGADIRPFVGRIILANACFCLILAAFFALSGQWILTFLPNGEVYRNYWWVIPWLIAISFTTSVTSVFFTSRIASGSFGFMKWFLPIDIIYALLLTVALGSIGDKSILPPFAWASAFNHMRIGSLSDMLVWMTGMNVIKASFCVISMFCRKNERCHCAKSVFN